MKILIYSDIHFSQYSSIVRSMGKKYSLRLEHLIKSLNWAEELSKKEHCNMVVNLGDMFDKPSLNSMELTALKEVKWNLSIPHYILVGNHDSNIASLEYNASEILKLLNLSTFDDRFHIISKPFVTTTVDFVNLFFIPYITEDNKKKLSDYKKELLPEDNGFSNICFSHNDIKGFQFGNFKSTEGFEIEDIEDNFNIYFNGHLHNPGYITKKILNVGNLCGQNFSENNFKTSHSAWILTHEDWEDESKRIKLTTYENPYALNFYKVEINKEHQSLNDYEFKDNAVLMIKCEKNYVDKVKEEIEENKKIIVSKIIVYNEDISDNNNEIKLEKVDYIKTFNDFILNKLGTDDIIKDELNTICN